MCNPAAVSSVLLLQPGMGVSPAAAASAASRGSSEAPGALPWRRRSSNPGSIGCFIATLNFSGDTPLALGTATTAAAAAAARAPLAVLLRPGRRAAALGPAVAGAGGCVGGGLSAVGLRCTVSGGTTEGMKGPNLLLREAVAKAPEVLTAPGDRGAVVAVANLAAAGAAVCGLAAAVGLATSIFAADTAASFTGLAAPDDALFS